MCYIATNSFLHKLNLIDNDLCSFCKSEKETISHIFYDCVHTKAFWADFVKWYSVIENDYKISKRIVLLGNVDGSCLENFLILLAKKHIYYARFQGQRPKILEAINLFKYYRNIEKYCVDVLQSRSKILSKWALYDNVFDK